MAWSQGSSRHLLEAQGHAVLFLSTERTTHWIVVALLEKFAGVGDLLGPGQIADVQETVDAFFDFDERAVVGEVADLAGDDGAGRDISRRATSMGWPRSASCRG